MVYNNELANKIGELISSANREIGNQSRDIANQTREGIAAIKQNMWAPESNDEWVFVYRFAACIKESTTGSSAVDNKFDIIISLH